MHFSTLIYRNCTRRLGRSLLTVSGLALAVATIVALVGIARGFEQSMAELYEGRQVDIIVVRAGGGQQLGTGLDEQLGEKIRGLPGVRRVSAGLADFVAMENVGVIGVLVRGLTPDSVEFNDVTVVAGRPLRPDDRDCIMLGKIVADSLNKSVGDTLEVIAGRPHKIVGIYESFSLYESGSILMLLEAMQRLLSREGEVSGFAVLGQRKDEASIRQLCAQITDLAPRVQAVPTREFVDSIIEIRRARALAWITSAIALVIGTIGTLNTMLTAVYERVREIAVLRAIGWRRRRVVRMIVTESVLLASVGAVAGTLLGLGLIQLLHRATSSGRLIAADVSPTVLLQGLAIALVIGFIGGLYPALLAARLTPTQGLRHE